jgi:hypothetical protein
MPENPTGRQDISEKNDVYLVFQSADDASVKLVLERNVGQLSFADQPNEFISIKDVDMDMPWYMSRLDAAVLCDWLQHMLDLDVAPKGERP